MKHTMDTLRERCRDDGECWEWRGAMVPAGIGHPSVMHEGKSWLVRRLVLVLHGHELTTRVKVVPVCGNARCINPDHLARHTHRHVMRQAAAQGKQSSRARSAAIARSWRERRAKLTWEDVRAIRASDATGVRLAAQHGVSEATISAIRLHRIWRDHAGPFAGLGAWT